MKVHIGDHAAERQDPVVFCRVISILEGELLEGLGINAPVAAAERLYRKLRKKNPALTAHDIARAVRGVRLHAEIWIDAVAARLDDRPIPYRCPRHWLKEVPHTVAAE